MMEKEQLVQLLFFLSGVRFVDWVGAAWFELGWVAGLLCGSGLRVGVGFWSGGWPIVKTTVPGNGAGLE